MKKKLVGHQQPHTNPLLHFLITQILLDDKRHINIETGMFTKMVIDLF